MLRRILTEELEEKAKNELNETTEIREESLNAIKEWVSEQDLVQEVTSELLLLNFLRGCKFNQQKARDKLSNYFLIRSNKSEFFQDRDPCNNALRRVLSQGIIIVLPVEDAESVLIRWTNCDKSSSFLDVIKLALMLFDIYINESTTCMLVGHNIFIDCKGLPLSYIKQITPSVVKDIVHILTKAYPSRIKAIYMINCSPFITFLCNMFKSILPSKLSSRIHFYNGNNMEKLNKKFTLAELPKEYGGEGESIDTLSDVTRNIIEERRIWFLNQERRFVPNNKTQSTS